jgi:hypothetical protein
MCRHQIPPQPRARAPIDMDEILNWPEYGTWPMCQQLQTNLLPDDNPAVRRAIYVLYGVSSEKIRELANDIPKLARFIAQRIIDGMEKTHGERRARHELYFWFMFAGEQVGFNLSQGLDIMTAMPATMAGTAFPLDPPAPEAVDRARKRFAPLTPEVLVRIAEIVHQTFG